jgi:hypothetical protein
MVSIFFNVESHTRKGKYYTVRRLPNGQWKCECPIQVYKNILCKHIIQAKQITAVIASEEAKKHINN